LIKAWAQAFELTSAIDRVFLPGSRAEYQAAAPPHDPVARFLQKVAKQNRIRLWFCLRCHRGCHRENCSYQFCDFEVIFILNTFRPSGLFMAGTNFINIAPGSRWKLDCRPTWHKGKTIAGSVSSLP